MRIRETLVDMVGEMFRAVAFVRQPQRQRYHAEGPVDGTPAGRMTMDDFMLKRGVKREQHGAQRSHEP
jgi:cyanophycinase-like exopeptidase